MRNAHTPLLKALVLGLCLSFSAPTSSFAQQSPALSEAEVEARARDIGRSLRCVVCQNQSIEESDASLAEDMRRLVRARVETGESKDEVIDFMQDRYGDFVLLKPPVQKNTYILWFAPLILVVLGLVWFLTQARRKIAAAPSPLSAEEQDRIDTLKDL